MAKHEVNVKKVVKKILIILGCIISFFAALLCLSIRWMFKTWANLSMDELMYHLNAPLEGTNEGMIKEYIYKCLFPSIVVLVIIVITIIICKKLNRKYYYLIGVFCVALGASGMSVYGAWNKLDVSGYVNNQNEVSTFIEDNYVDPRSVTMTFPDKKKNLIYIFLESMEMTYADKEDGGAFEKNVIPELTELAQENEDFSGESKQLNGGYSMPGTTWTMGAMFAQTSGLPLKISIDGNDMDTQESFFPEIVTIGDILQDVGYSQTLLIGSDATFGGRRLYFTDHGNYDIIDYNYALEQGWIPEDYRVWWGYEDEKLFGFAKSKLEELSMQEEPFNLTMLTVDTHFEDGYSCELCGNEFEDNQYANVMACSSRQVADFVKWIQQQDFYEDTTIVISGDHPTMDSDFCENVDPDYQRKVYTTYINAGTSECTDTRSYTTFDNFPTTLASLGVKIEGDRLGLGTNLFSSTQTLTERYGIDQERTELQKKSELLEKLAAIDEESEALLVREGKNPSAEVSVGEYAYQTASFPIIVQNITGIDTVQSVMAAVWKNEDQSDLQWFALPQMEDGSYSLNVDITQFGYATGEYQVHIYAVDNDGQQYMVGNGNVLVQ